MGGFAGDISTVIGIVLMVPAMLGYLLYGWLLYQTVTSETNPWIKALFASTFMFWLLTVAGLVFFAVLFLREKDHEEDEANTKYFTLVHCEQDRESFQKNLLYS